MGWGKGGWGGVVVEDSSLGEGEGSEETGTNSIVGDDTDHT